MKFILKKMEKKVKNRKAATFVCSLSYKKIIKENNICRRKA